MPVADNATLLDRGPNLRPISFALRRSRIVPGPLKSLEQRGRERVRVAGLGLVGLSLVATLAVAPQIRAGVSTPAPDSVVASEPAKDVVEPVRIVGVGPAPQSVPVPTVPAAIEDQLAEPAEAILAEPQSSPPATVVPSKPKSARPADLGPLPVLELDAAAFDALTTPPIESAIPPAGRVAGRP